MYAVVFCGGEYFPQDVNRIQRRNLSLWADPLPTFAQTTSYSDIQREIKLLLSAALNVEKVGGLRRKWQGERRKYAGAVMTGHELVPDSSFWFSLLQ